jgi:hypothetical protein
LLAPFRAAGQTRPRWRALLRRLIARLDPDGEHRRHTAARSTREVSYRALPDGMGSIWARLSATDTEAVWQTLCRLAKALGPDDPRTLDQRRADLLVDLCTGRLTLTDTAQLTAQLSAQLRAQVTAALTQLRDTDHPDPGENTATTTGETAAADSADPGASGTHTDPAAADTATAGPGSQKHR